MFFKMTILFLEDEWRNWRMDDPEFGATMCRGRRGVSAVRNSSNNSGMGHAGDEGEK